MSEEELTVGTSYTYKTTEGEPNIDEFVRPRMAVTSPYEPTPVLDFEKFGIMSVISSELFLLSIDYSSPLKAVALSGHDKYLLKSP